MDLQLLTVVVDEKFYTLAIISTELKGQDHILTWDLIFKKKL